MQQAERENYRKLAFVSAFFAPTAIRHHLETLAILGEALDTLTHHLVDMGGWILNHGIRPYPIASTAVLAGMNGAVLVVAIVRLRKARKASR
jgi:hypothetical protein